jgi:excinuclease ABC subunit C
MIKFSFISKNKIEKLPKNSGVYCFKNNNKILYIGKAINLLERIKNHFLAPNYRDNLFIKRVKKIGYIKTDSEIEALILEARLIKKYKPKYNVIWRDDKNFFYIAITKEKLPRVFITHQPKLNTKHIGPFVDGRALKQSLRYLRKIFPYYSTKKHPKTFCPWCQLELCPGPNPQTKKYKRNIKNLIMVLTGQKQSVLKNLKKQMELASQKQNFEEAAKIRNQIISLEKVMSHHQIFNAAEAMVTEKLWHSYRNNNELNWKEIEKELKNVLKIKREIKRIEAYDVSNIQGKKATGSMVTFFCGQPDKNSYRKFKIRFKFTPNDTAMLKEILIRRFRHPEWPFPDLILIDGGKSQFNTAKLIVQSFKLKSEIIALTKDKRHRGIKIYNEKIGVIELINLNPDLSNLLLRINQEAHRFALTYHRKLMNIDLFKKL